MRKKKYQVFVSSTYNDLIEERKEVTQALLENDCIPVGMELFPASNKKQWEIIKSVIDDSDYYLLIIAGRYGSIGKDDNDNSVGYTEMEYDYALKTGKPIIVFLHRDFFSLPLGKCEKSNIGRKRLEAFRRKASTGREVAFWDNKDNLKSAVITSIRGTINDYPNGGWIKAQELSDDNTPIFDDAESDNISGIWKSVTEQNFEDESKLTYNSSTHLITGHIIRMKPENQKNRKWKCIGCVVGDTMTMIYYSRHSAGCALFRHHYEDSYEGYYLRFDYGKRLIEKQSVRLEKSLEN